VRSVPVTTLVQPHMHSRIHFCYCSSPGSLRTVCRYHGDDDFYYY